MSIKKLLSYLGGYFNSKEFKVDLDNMPLIAEIDDVTFIEELNKLVETGDIQFDNDIITLVNIEPKNNKRFNDMYKPVPTMYWKHGEKLVLDVV